MISQARGTIHFRMLEFHQQYGPVVRLAPGELTYTTATAVKDIYGGRSGRKLMGPQSSLGTNEKATFGATSFLWLEDHKEHARHRKVVGQMFSESSLKAQEPLVLGYATLLMRRFRERAERGEVVDMWAWFNFYTFVCDHFLRLDLLIQSLGVVHGDPTRRPIEHNPAPPVNLETGSKR